MAPVVVAAHLAEYQPDESPLLLPTATFDVGGTAIAGPPPNMPPSVPVEASYSKTRGAATVWD